MKVPRSLQTLMERAEGVRQPEIDWSRGRWMSRLPSYPIFERLPNMLDREQVKGVCAGSTVSEDSAVDAFLTAMAWGYGNVGYGPWRVEQALRDSHAKQKVYRVAAALDQDGPLAAYRLFATECRLTKIGPAFATKFLYFVDSGKHDTHALILDRLVAKWLLLRADYPVNPVPWSPTAYQDYLDRMHEWAAALRVTPAALELAMFQDMSDAEGNQWSPGSAPNRAQSKAK